ncbi:MAG: hypothetical protein ABIT07_13330 [Ferruginibacter sp.]
MKKGCIIFSLTIFILALFSKPSFAQPLSEPKIKLFVDCSNAFCDQDYIKTQITFVDYVLDNKVADVHLLITEQNNGGGGSQFQLIFYGQNRFHQSDTLHFNTTAENTGFEKRELLVKYIRLGLVPYLSKTNLIGQLTVSFKETAKTDSSAKVQTKDPWNYWVYRVGVNGNINADANYKGSNYNGNLSAGRITDQSKVSFNLSVGRNKNSFEFNDGSATTKIIVKNENYEFSHQYVKTVSGHWSVGYDLGLFRSTFTNYKARAFLRPAIEYNIYPYKDVNNKFFTIRYGVDVAYNSYFDTTLYFKTHETLPGQALDLSLTYNQKWGSVNLSSGYHAYLNNLKYYNLSLGGGVSVRVSGGLSFNVFLFGNILRDQIYLPKGQATAQDILTRQRQLATSFSIFSFFGISYRFGSKLNNFVNPRFNSGNGNFSFSN